MAKLRNLRPLAGKQRIRLSFSKLAGATGTKITLKAVLNEIDKKIPGLTPGSLGHYFFKIVRINVDSSLGNSILPIELFGRVYEFSNLSNYAGHDASISPEPTEWWGLYHDVQVLEALADKGASTGLDEIQVVDFLANENKIGEIVVDFVPKKD